MQRESSSWNPISLPPPSRNSAAEEERKRVEDHHQREQQRHMVVRTPDGRDRTYYASAVSFLYILSAY